MATTRIRTLNFLPEIFQTSTNSQFLGATLDQLVNPPITKRIEGYVGSKLGYGVNAKDYYVTEPTKVRTDYQLDPGIVFTKKNESTAQDFITYPGIIDSLRLEGGVTNNNDRMFESQFYSWDSFTNLDKIINFNQYYWLPDGPPAVQVAAATVFATNDYIVTDLANGYNIRTLGTGAGSINPTLILLRGGTYNFYVNQSSQFWIQTAPGTSGYNPTQPNVYTRDVFGVSNNGAEQGIVTFTVPAKDAQDQYNYPGNNLVDVVSTIPFSQINGQLLSTVGGIDGVTALNGLTVMFYDTGVPNETGYTSQYFGEGEYDTNIDLVAPLTITISATDVSGAITCSSTANLISGQTITFDGTPFGGLDSYAVSGTIYYVDSILSSTQFTVTSYQAGSPDPQPVTLTTAFGLLTGNINQGLLEEGYTSIVSQNFYQISYIGDPSDPVLRLTPVGVIPTEQRITPVYGSTWINRGFYRNTLGVISLIPAITAPLDTLYYQDGTSPTKVGIIKIIESNITNTLNVETDILGRKNFTSTNGVTFTNGLKVEFDGDVIPSSYLQGQYYVEGVGTAIELVPVSSLVCPEDFTEGDYIPYDTAPFDIGNYDSNLYVPVLQDYITIARNAINKNAWSRSNRWFHIDVINATSEYNNNPDIVNVYATAEAKAKRPIIEFYPNLKLFDSGVVGKSAIDFIDFKATDALSQVSGQTGYYPDVETYTDFTGTLNGVVSGTSTTATIATSDIIGTFQIGQYITDSRFSTITTTYPSLLPSDAQITDIVEASGTTTLTIGWGDTLTFSTINNVQFVADDQQNDNYKVFDGARIVFAADTNVNVKNKIYIVNFSTVSSSLLPVITLTEAPNGEILPDDQTVVLRGFNYQGDTYFYNGIEWIKAQQKTDVNQPPLFDVVDSNNISFGDKTVYRGTTFIGSKLFAYGIGSGLDDTVLGFPVRYSSIDNVGDISFDVSLNVDTFDYVSGTDPKTQKVNTGYVLNYSDRDVYERELGWQTAIGPSVQYQVFSFDYSVANPPADYVCDIAKLDDADSAWPTIQVYINNVLQTSDAYTVTVGSDSTTVTLNNIINVDTVIQILLLSNQVSLKSYYTIPINLNNNPLNEDLTTANIGDIRAHYQTIYANNPNFQGPMFGSNNYRDLGDLVPYGTKIIQNSAALVLPGAFLRKQNHNLFDALLFNSREYIKFKTLLVDTVNSTDYVQRFSPSYILDDALDQLSAAKSDSQAFFWSDMLPSKAPYITNTYTFNNDLDTSVYPLSRIYDFSTANYYGVLVYLSRVIEGTVVERQLIKGEEYTVSDDSKSLTVVIPLQPADQIIVKEYNQTYGSYIPNTPTKLGLYPAYIPGVVLDSDYTQPTYFIKGHDGSYTKLYGDYNPTLGVLVDYRDQALLEFETRIYNNLKLSNPIPIQAYEVTPGFFRDSDYTYDEYLEIYEKNFLNWVGQNRINYKRQYYDKNNPFTYNYTDSGNKLNKQPIQQGYWRGIYEYYFGTSTPNQTPWELLGFVNQPSWWTDRYGPAPYTSDNLILWGDLEQGINWNNGNPYVIPEEVRPNLLKVLPVDSNGDLLSPLDAVVGNYDVQTFQQEWVIGDDAPVELSYRRSSTWPFDLMRILALTKPAKFFNLGVDLDNYKYSTEFNQYLVNDRSHLVISNIEIYGTGIPKTSYINWIVDYEKQLGITATQNIKDLLFNIDVRLIYRLAGFSDKTLLKFYVEKGTPNSRNSSLLIPDESYQVLLYDNQPFDKNVYSSIVIQIDPAGFTVYGNSQSMAYFRTLTPANNGNYDYIKVDNANVKITKDYTPEEILVPYGTTFYNVQDLSQFIASYGAWLNSKGFIFDQVEYGLEINWGQMIAEFLYWSQTGWGEGAILTLNPGATLLKVDQPNSIVQPLTVQQTNFVLNQNLYPIQAVDMSVFRDGTLFTVKPLSQGDTIAYGQFNMSNFEHGIVFDNVTLFNDIIYNLVTGLRQTRITVRGTKTAEWNGTVTASGFILNQDNIQEWSREIKYTKGSIVLYKNKYWTALKIIQPANVFNENDWKETEYNEIQKGLLPNSSTRSYESTLYYDVNKANLEQDADLLSFSLIGYRPRDYLALADLTDITQINVYKNMIKNKGTRNAVEAFRGATLPQGGIDYEVYENWAIKSGQFGAITNNNFVEFKVNQEYMTANPSLVSLINGPSVAFVQQEVPVYNLYNYSAPVQDPNILATIPKNAPARIYPDAGYVNFNDVKMSSYFYSGLPNAVNKNGQVVPIQDFYVRNYVWLADYLAKWQVFTPVQNGRVVSVRTNPNGTSTVRFAEPHNLSKLDPFAIINFNSNVDGYYFVTEVVNLFEVLINLTFLTNDGQINGEGIAVRFQSQRVDKPSDINNLPLLDSEFIKNTVWVDENTDGNWAVYRKSINYQFDREVTKDNSTSFGSAVAYTPRIGYLFADAGLGSVYRYVLNDLTKEYDNIQTLTQGTSFGSQVLIVNNTIFVSEPTSGTPKVYIYYVNDSILSDDIIPYQSAITAPIGVTDWGSALSASPDGNWLYVSDTGNNKVYVYRRQSFEVDAGYLIAGKTYAITNVGDTDFAAISTTPTTTLNQIGEVFIATGAGTAGETGRARQINYALVNIIDGATLGLSAGDNFGHSISTDYNGDTILISAPYIDYSGSILNWGKAYVYHRSTQTFEAQLNTSGLQLFTLAWTGTTLDSATTQIYASNQIGVNVDFTGYENYPIVFTGSNFGTTGLQANKVYYIDTVVSSTRITVKESRSSASAVTLNAEAGLSINGYLQLEPLYVTVNGTLIADNNYSVIGSTLYYTAPLLAGDIINVSGDKFTLIQSFTTNKDPRVGVQYGFSVATNNSGTDLLVGAPFDLSDNNEEGAVYRYTNGGSKYGVVIGVNEVNVTTNRVLLINGYSVTIPSGDATVAADAIVSEKITNITAAATSDNKLIIQVINTDLAQPNEKLLITAIDPNTLTDLGLQVYTETQVIRCPHKAGPTQFGYNIKFNELNSIVVSAPVATRFAGTRFDFSDDETVENDTIFDNNATQFVDKSPNCGAVYMYDYLANFNENLNDPGQYIYAQSINNYNLDYGFSPLYGQALSFSNNRVLVGSPNFLPGIDDGQIVVYINPTGEADWSVYRESAPVVDINKIKNIQLFSAETNNTLVNLDYIDPLQGKILGACRENIDVVSNNDPARYNSTDADQPGVVWGAKQVGQLWFNTTNVRFVNYHQNNDANYNAKYWGTVFPGSDVAVYSWVTSNVPPNQYVGPGTPYDITLYSTQNILNASNNITPVYFFWVRNSNIIFRKEGKTLSDTIIETYITNPKNSGISFFAPLLQNVYAIYNSGSYYNANDSVLHIGYSNGRGDDNGHNEFTLIRANYADDFLPGLPNELLTHGFDANIHGDTPAGNNRPESLYDRMLDSLAGVDESGEVVPNPWLPKAVQSGVLARPRQSFFFDRFEALKNYLTYANEVLAQYPISEIRRNASFLFTEGEFFNTTDYWEYVNWWATGYDNNTKSAIQVAIYADLATLTVPINTIVTVNTNGDGKFEVYRYDGDGVWTRIGLQQGTIQFKLYLWDYAAGKTGFGDNFFDTSSYDEFPSEETRYIVRALNEQIYTDELLIYRNKSLVLLFEYIQSETDESQNYLPWLNKTSLIDVAHKIRELRPIEVFQSDNQDFLAGYINEVKPYHVVVKEFVFKYTGEEVFDGNITDFDLPATYNTALQQYITPELVQTNVSSDSQYLPTNPIWQTQPYNQWFQNRGVSIGGQTEFEITVLASYLTLKTAFILVDNAQGFPINGLIRIGQELISYSYVDRATNIISGLIRGVNNTPISDHIPGEKIFIDLPPILVLNGGRGYIDPPRVIAYVDEALYGPPLRAAVLEAVMTLDSVLQINVIDPGQGYPVLPEIRIDPALQIIFSSTDVNSLTNTIRLYAPNLRTGDLIQYKKGEIGSEIGGLVDRQWYYVNLLESDPTAVIGLYQSYGDALNDRDRIQIYNDGSGNDHTLNLGAKASAITTASPVRENNIKLRFDRTTYTSQVQDWEAGQYYGAFFAGSYSNSEKVSSSAVKLYSSQPPIEEILASAQGVAFEIVSVVNDRNLSWSSFVRTVDSTISTNNLIRLKPYDDGAGDPNSSGSTVGFYVGMPIKFSGQIPSPLVIDTIYYVHSIVNITDFTVSATEGGPQLTGFSTVAIPATPGAYAYAGQVVDKAVLTVNYPGILTATATQTATNRVTIPLTEIGTGGTIGFYVGLPLFFTDGAFGGVTQNQVYYVTTIIDNQTFTMSETSDPLMLSVTATTTGTDIITIEANEDLSVNEPVIFNEMQIAGADVTSFGNIVSGTTYYINEIVSNTQIKISTAINGTVFALTTVAAASDTGCTLTSQVNTLPLTTATGSMTVNVSLPVSPGQVNGQQFILYETSSQYADIQVVGADITNLIERTLTATLENDKVGIKNSTGGVDNFYYNLPIRVETPPAGSGLSAGTTYYVVEYTGMEDPLNPGEYFPNLETEVYNTSSSYNILTCDSTDNLYVGMSIVFSGQALGGIVISDEYFVRYFVTDAGDFVVGKTYTIEVPGTTNFIAIGAADNNPGTTFVATGVGSGTGSAYGEYPSVGGTKFKISEVKGGSVKTLTTGNGVMTGTGDPYVKLSLSAGGSPEDLSYTNTEFNLVQFPSSSESPPILPTFDVSYILGGYRVLISDGGHGFAIDNQLVIPGNQLGGSTTANDLTMIVNSIDSNGAITDVICSGTVPGINARYYLKVISPNQFEVYSDPLMQVPVSGIDFPFVGFTTTIATAVTASNDRVTVTSSSDFDVNDPVVFTGTMFSSEITVGQTYYIYDKPTSTTVRLTTEPGGAVINIASNATGSMTMAKAGSFALLPEPFYFNQSIVKFNNRVYICVVSNNDTEFIFGKWELLDPADRRLNALDRTIGYYQPTDNMPGVDLTQLYTGITYPNATYLGNPFAPADQFTLDTVLQGQEFYPTEVDVTSVIWNGTNYLAAANIPTYSAVLGSSTGDTWAIAKLANVGIGATDIIYAGGYYIITSTNSATPIYRSNDGITWTTNGYFTPYGSTPYDDIPYDMTSINIASLSLYSVAYKNGYYMAVGDSIVRSDDTYVWRESFNFNTVLNNTLYGVSPITLLSGPVTIFDGFIAVGKGQRYDYSTGLTQIVDTNIIVQTTDGISWTQLPSATKKGMYGVTANSSIALVVGEDGIIYYSQNGTDWIGVTETQVTGINGSTDVLGISSISGLAVNDAVRFTDSFDVLSSGTTYYVHTVISSTQIQITDAIGNPPIDLSGAGSIPAQTIMYKYPRTDTLRDVLWANSQFMAVGDNGRITTSPDGVIWTERTSGTIQKLNGLNYVSGNIWVVVGDNNTILKSVDNGVTWESSSLFVVAPTVYDVVGDPFQAGYGPEELVPGLVTDALTMTVATRPGTNWPITEYAHSGYNVVSYEIPATSVTQTVYYWGGTVLIPAQVACFVIDGTTGLSTSLYESLDYTVDWINNAIILNTPINYLSPTTDSLRIDVYEVGNGDQLVKANTKTDPIRTNTTTGFNEIYLNCNYSNLYFQGSGVIRPGTNSIEVTAIATNGTNNTILCDDVTKFTINTPIYFQGITFGNILEDTAYYVKSISTVTSSITVSASYNAITGTAGPTLTLTTATGLMTAIIQTGTGSVWTDPIVYHNGTQLVLGKTNSVTRTKASNNAITTNSTGGLIANTPITFSNTMFGSVIVPQTVYYIKTIVDSNEFTISATPGGPVIPLTNATGGAVFVTNDYAFGIQPNSVSAKMILAAQYDNSVDYLVYSVFGETAPDQYAFTIPQVQTFTGDGSTSSFALNNYVGDDNPYNAIVEINGLRITKALYNISSVTNSILFNSPPPNGSTIAVTTYNSTDRQYFNSQYGITGTPGSAFVQVIVESTNHSEYPFDAVVNAGDFDIGYEYVIDTVGTTDFTLIGAASNTPGVSFIATGAGTGTGTAYVGYDTTAYDEELNWLTCAPGYDTSGLTVGSSIVFSAPTLDGIVAGTTYFITEIWNSTQFVISTELAGDALPLTDDTGSMIATVNGLTVADITNIDNNITPPLATTNATATSVTSVSAGSFVVGRPYVISTIGTTDFTLIGAASNTVGETFTATGIGSGTGTADYYDITVTSSTNFVLGQTIQFKGTAFGTLNTNGLVYFVKYFNAGTVVIADENGNVIQLTNDTGNVIVIVGGTPAVRVTTGVPHNLTENTLVRIDGVSGSTQLNNNTYYAKIITTNIVDLYSQPYNPGPTVTNYPVTDVSTYTGGGYMWRDELFTITTTTATATTAVSNLITVASNTSLVVDTPVIFTSPGISIGNVIMGNIVAGTTYYVKSKSGINSFTISETRGGDTFVLTTDTPVTSVNVSQWDQYNVDRLWVTVNGYRIPSSKLRLNTYNNLSILTTIVPGDEVIITSMIINSTPDEEVYQLVVNQVNEPVVYRANTLTRTWLTAPLYELDEYIEVDDVTRLTDSTVQTVTTPAAVNGIYTIGLTADKNLISNVTIYNNNPSRLGLIPQSAYSIVVEALSPLVKLTAGSYVQPGDILTVTTLEGKVIYINGEQIKFETIDLINNTLSGLQRGFNGTGIQPYIPIYSEVYSRLSNNLLTDLDYNVTWNSDTYNPVEGDPLQISTTSAAEFLYTDVT